MFQKNMRRNRSPEFVQIRESNTRSQETKELSLLQNRARKFLKQTYALSEKGKELATQIREALDEKNDTTLEELQHQIPTVEHTHLDLFEPLALKEEELEVIIGSELANIQTTKGCSHGCEFCAAGATNHIETMPFAAIAQIAEYKDNNPTEEALLFSDWIETVQKEIGIDLRQEEIKKRSGKDIPSLSPEEFERITKQLIELYTKHPLFQRYPISFSPFMETYLDYLEAYGSIPKKGYTVSQHDSLTNYYDSDPFDYQDNTFLHEDGTPADYGDVVTLLATETRPIHITTAGWRINNTTAQRAAEKIVALHKKNPSLLATIDISVNKSEKLARKDYSAYLDMMKSTISTLQEVHPRIFLVYDDTEEYQDFITQVVKPLTLFCKKELSESHIITREFPVSNYSLNIQKENHTDTDIMACMPGYHIWPDGTVAKQELQQSPGWSQKKVLDGTRPTPIENKKLFHTTQ
jgi:hypothetical protein